MSKRPIDPKAGAPQSNRKSGFTCVDCTERTQAAKLTWAGVLCLGCLSERRARGQRI